MPNYQFCSCFSGGWMCLKAPPSVASINFTIRPHSTCSNLPLSLVCHCYRHSALCFIMPACLRLVDLGGPMCRRLCSTVEDPCCRLVPWLVSNSLHLPFLWHRCHAVPLHSLSKTATCYLNIIRCCLKALLVCHIATLLGQLVHIFFVHLLFVYR
jgi:hypothetical protein